MTGEGRIAALEAFGYDIQEARFLCLAALHGGYFVRRQYLAFVGGTKGWKDVALLQKLEANGHVRSTAYRHNHRVHHLCSKPFYAALGEADNRNRRERRPLTIKTKLMALDFVLAHPAYTYLAAEREKLDYFVGRLGIARAKLPTRWYHATSGGEAAAKHFVDKFPIFLAEGVRSPVVGFAYIDEGQQSTQGFATHLRQYGPLLAEISAWQVMYVAARQRLFEKARAAFEAFATTLHQAPSDPETRELHEYFRARQKYEARDFAGFDTARLVRYRQEKTQFAGGHYEALYRQWLEQGDEALAASASGTPPAAPQLEFSTYLLEHDYDLFGTLTSAA